MSESLVGFFPPGGPERKRLCERDCGWECEVLPLSRCGSDRVSGKGSGRFGARDGPLECRAALARRCVPLAPFLLL